MTKREKSALRAVYRAERAFRSHRSADTFHKLMRARYTFFKLGPFAVVPVLSSDSLPLDRLGGRYGR